MRRGTESPYSVVDLASSGRNRKGSEMRMACLLVVLLCLLGLCGCKATPVPEQFSFYNQEASFLYLSAMRGLAAEYGGKLPVKGEKVWVVNLVGGKNTDSPVDAYTQDAWIAGLLAAKHCQVVEKDEDIVRDLYVEHAESKSLDLKKKTLAEGAGMENVSKIVAFRVVRLDATKWSALTNVARGVVGFWREWTSTRSVRISLHLRVIDVKAGTVEFAHYLDVEKVNRWFVGHDMYK